MKKITKKASEKGRRSQVKKIVKRSLVGLALGFHLTTQENYCVNGEEDSQQRKAFEEQFGFSVQGFRKNVEDAEGNVSKLALAVYKEKLEKDFDLATIRISSPSYLQKSIPGQLEHIIVKGGEAYDGINFPYIDRIYLDDTFSVVTELEGCIQSGQF